MKKWYCLFIVFAAFYVKGQNFTPNNLLVVKTSDRSGSLTNNGDTVFLDEYTKSGSLVGSLQMPVSISGGNKRFVIAGNSLSQGSLKLSSDRRYVTIAGFDTIPNSAAGALNGTTSVNINRVIAIVDANKNINTSNFFTDFASGGDPRSAYTTNGSNLWFSGSSDGVKYATSGTGNTSLKLTGSYTNMRWIDVYDGQLYTTSGINSVSGNPDTIRFSKVGTGIPTTAPANIQNINNIKKTSSSPYDFFLADHNPSIPGVDVLYIIDDGGIGGAANSGIYKYSFDGTNWISNGFSTNGGSSDYRSVTGVTCGSTDTLYIVRKSGTTGGVLIKFIDNTGWNQTIPTISISNTTMLDSLTTAKQAFRGISFTPGSMQDITVSGVQTINAGDYRNIFINSGTATLNVNVTARNITVKSGATLILNGNIYVGNLTVNNGATLNCGNSQVLGINNCTNSIFYLDNGATLKIGDANGITIAGNNSGAIQTVVRTYSTGGNYEYIGNTVNQVTGNGLPATVNNLTFSNSNNDSLTNSVAVNGNLNFTNNSHVILGANNLTINNGANISNYNSTQYIVTNSTGVLTINNVGATDNVFPVGISINSYNPAIINNIGTADNFSVRVDTCRGSCLSNVNSLHTPRKLWYINEALPGGSDATITLHWNGFDEAGDGVSPSLFNRNNCFVIHHDGVSVDKYGTPGPATVAGLTSRGSGGFTHFSPYTVSSDPVILPLSNLISFNAEKNNINQVELNWNVTASNEFISYEIQKSKNGNNWDPLRVVNNINEQLAYNFTDSYLFEGVNYYRLKITFKNGTIIYSKIVTVVNKKNGIEIIGLTPTLTMDGILTVNLMANKSGKIDLLITDAVGKKIDTKSYMIAEGTKAIQLNARNLSNGVYNIMGITPEGNTQVYRFVKQ